MNKRILVLLILLSLLDAAAAAAAMYHLDNARLPLTEAFCLLRAACSL